ncbi:MAG: class I SAM-dependent methyltransferase [Hahellaceae bacterium]|nr:class I SAM-dependent methyltransferase [Hahellaceae bacterium]
MIPLSVAYTPLRLDEAVLFAKTWQFPVVAETELPRPDANRQYVLAFTDERIELRSWYKGAPGPVYVDFVSGAADYRRLHGGGRGEMIARAVGLRKGVALVSVLDATAGLGGDAFVLASLGCQMTLLERHPVVYCLLADGLKRLAESPLQDLAARITLHRGSLLNAVPEWSEGLPDVVYLDPMFPEKKKKAQVRKEMQVFHEVVGDDPDGDGLLTRALAMPVKRVVVKRPRLAPAMTGPKPDVVLEGKSCRYDIYARHKIQSS